MGLPLEDWPYPALPTEPTAGEIAAAILAREAERGVKRDKAALKRQGAMALAADVVGEPIDRLSAKQLAAILALLHPELVDDNLLVRAVEEWA